MTKTIQLYSYFRSSASYRVRIALHLKKIPFDYQPVHLLKDGGQQHLPSYSALNPLREVPCLVYDNKALSQSMAIIYFLDDLVPEPRLLPPDSMLKAEIIQFCEGINSGIHPLQNLKVLQELERRFAADQTAKESWISYWITRGFEGLETLLKSTAGQYCFGNQVTAADLFLVPQVYNAQRYKIDLDPFPLIKRVNENALTLNAFQKARPENQPDFSL